MKGNNWKKKKENNTLSAERRSLSLLFYFILGLFICLLGWRLHTGSSSCQAFCHWDTSPAIKKKCTFIWQGLTKFPKLAWCHYVTQASLGAVIFLLLPPLWSNGRKDYTTSPALSLHVCSSLCTMHKFCVSVSLCLTGCVDLFTLPHALSPSFQQTEFHAEHQAYIWAWGYWCVESGCHHLCQPLCILKRYMEL